MPQLTEDNERVSYVKDGHSEIETDRPATYIEAKTLTGRTIQIYLSDESVTIIGPWMETERQASNMIRMKFK